MKERNGFVMPMGATTSTSSETSRCHFCHADNSGIIRVTANIFLVISKKLLAISEGRSKWTKAYLLVDKLSQLLTVDGTLVGNCVFYHNNLNYCSIKCRFTENRLQYFCLENTSVGICPSPNLCCTMHNRAAFNSENLTIPPLLSLQLISTENNGKTRSLKLADVSL